jgi:hypothetical protein
MGTEHIVPVLAIYALGISGPHHPCVAAGAAGTILTAIEQKLIHGMGSDHDHVV